MFAAMDPYDLRVLKQDDPAVPLIKIVFALADSLSQRCPPQSNKELSCHYLRDLVCWAFSRFLGPIILKRRGFGIHCSKLPTVGKNYTRRPQRLQQLYDKLQLQVQREMLVIIPVGQDGGHSHLDQSVIRRRHDGELVIISCLFFV